MPKIFIRLDQISKMASSKLIAVICFFVLALSFLVEAKKTECGVNQSMKTMQNTHTHALRQNPYPWNVGVYKKTGTEKKLICGGTIVDNEKIITAAHCFYDISTKEVDLTSSYYIGAGKIYKDLGQPEDSHYEQAIKVKEVIIPGKYDGEKQLHKYDIAILKLKTPLTYSYDVTPACLDLSDESNIATDTVGKVSGFGATMKYENPSKMLKTQSMVVVDKKDCDKKNADIKQYLTRKFCAQYQANDQPFGMGDGGAGFMVKIKDENNVERVFLKGVLSVEILNYNTYPVFTNIYKARKWLTDML